MRRRRAIPPPHYLFGNLGKHKSGAKPPANPAPTPHEIAEHQGRVPQPGVRSGPRQTVPALPSSPAYGAPVYPSRGSSNVTRVRTTAQAEVPSLPAVLSPLAQIADLLTPGPTAHETAAAALRLGVKPKAAAEQHQPSSGEKAVADATKAISDAVNTASHAVAHVAKQATKMPDKRVHAFGDKPTLGTPTVAQLMAAAQKGKLRLNKHGKVTVPATRRAARTLAATRANVAAAAQPDVSGLSRAERAVIPYVLKAHRKYPDIPVSVLMAQIRQESGFNPAAVSSAGAEGLSQFIPSTAASYGVKYGTGRKEQQTQVTGQAHYLHDLGFAKDPQGALSSYSGGYAASDYNNPIVQGARDYATLDQPGKVPPKVAAAYKAAKERADNLGIPTKGGDVERGSQPNTVFVRADAKGMVDWAKALLGTQEGSRLQLKWAAQAGVSASEPWCSEFIAAGVERRGLPAPDNPAYSGTWLSWRGGTNIGTDLRKAKPGDIIVFGPASSTAHVGLYVGGGQMISGNYGNEVAQAPISQETASEPIAGIVRPHFKGGKVAVQEAAMLPGAAIGPAGEIVSGPAGAAGGSATGSSAPRPHVTSALSALPALLATLDLSPQVNLGEPEEEGEEGVIQQILKRRSRA